MTLAADELKFLLLDMLSSTRMADRGMMAELGESEWRMVEEMARQHRLEPLLHHQLQSVGRDWIVSAATRRRWARAHWKSALRSLSVQQTLIGINAILDEQGIPYAALKGAWLARHAYQHPALRPTRDIDIIVPPDRALDAFAALIDAGFKRRNKYAAKLDFALAHGKHLPGLCCPKSNIDVEIHHHLINHSPRRDRLILDTQGLIDRRVWKNAGEVRLPFLPHTDGLLHLIIHSVYEHGFNNGPLVMNDIEAMLSIASVDWLRFWKIAAAGGWSSGCRLLLSLVEHYHGGALICWPGATPGRPPEDVMKMAALMTLQNHQQRGNVNLFSEFKSARTMRAKLAVAIRRAKPTPHALAAYAKISAQSRWLWFNYPNWLIGRLLSQAFNLSTASLRAELPRATQVRAWLGE